MLNQDHLQNLRHSLAHLLAAAVRALYPGAKNAIGPAIDDGFYQDFELPGPISDKDLPKIEKKMRQLLPTWKKFERKEVTPQEAKKEFGWNEYKTELIEDFAKEAKNLTFYTCGGLVDLCKGGHTQNPSKDIKPDTFKLDRVAGAYWKGSEKNKMLTRIYGVAFASKTELDAYLARREEAKKRDHKILGPKLDLFVFSDLVGAGLPLFTPKGTVLRDLLDSYVWELRRERGYARVDIPHVTKKELYETSGHWSKFASELFRITTRDGHSFAMKPMNCPHHVQIYARKQWSYRELPQRYASTTKVYRDEQTGELSGLVRVRSITQDDAHVFCRMSQAQAELQKIWEIVHLFYQACGLPLKLRLSTHDPKQPEKYLGDKARWHKAEDILRAVAKTNQSQYLEAVGEAAFYAPKLDFVATDSLGREWQMATIQLDILMPERFDLTCVAEDGKPERIVMIHAAIMGAIERFLSILIEHYAGAFPVWLAPVQIAILPVSDKFNDYAKKIAQDLRGKIYDLRIEVDERNESVGKKIRESEMHKIPYMLIVGEKEKNANAINVRKRGQKDQETLRIEKFSELILREIQSKKN